MQIQEALSTCKYPAWAINRMKVKTNTPRNNNSNKDNKPICKSYITVPYNEGLSETFKNICKESMFIRANNPSLNRNIGKYHLLHIWDEVLVNNTELKLK